MGLCWLPHLLSDYGRGGGWDGKILEGHTHPPPFCYAAHRLAGKGTLWPGGRKPRLADGEIQLAALRMDLPPPQPTGQRDDMLGVR